MLVISTASGLWISIILSILVLVFSNIRQGWRIATRLSGINVLLAIFLFSQIFNSPVMSAVLRLDCFLAGMGRGKFKFTQAAHFLS